MFLLKRIVSSTSFAIFCLIALAYLGVYKVIVKGLDDLSFYHGAQLHYASAQAIKSTDFARLIDAKSATYGFAEIKGHEPNATVLLSQSAEVVLKASSAYLPSVCSAKGRNQAHLRVNGSNVLYNEVMREGQIDEVRFNAFKGDEIVVSVANPSEQGCGGVFVTFHKPNHAKHYPLIFAFIWCVLLLIFSQFSLPRHIVLFAVGLNFLVLLVHKQLGVSDLEQLLFSTYISVLFSGIWLLILALCKFRVVRVLLLAPLIIIALLLPVTFLGHELVFGVPPTVDTFHAMLQSHTNQIIEFWSKILGLGYIVGTAIVLIAILALLYRLSAARVRQSVAAMIGVCVLLFSATNYQQFLDTSPMLRMAVSAVSSYFHELRAFQELDRKRTANPDGISASSSQSDTTLVVIIGESANKTHMSAYGYPRLTTPAVDALLVEGKLLRFNAAYSNHTYSNPTISRSLTAASNYNNRSWVGEPSALAVANASDISTTWISNKLKFGPWDNVMSVIGDDAQQTIHINSKVGKNLVSNRYDGALVPLLEKALDKKQGNKLIFIHLQGSHVDYTARYPASYAKYSAPLSPVEMGAIENLPRSTPPVVNSYDNSILYTDSVFEQVIALLEQQSNNTALLYFSDHGESVFGRRSHNAAVFEYDMTTIPLLFWANADWRQRYSDKWSNLSTNIDKVFTNDHIFDTVLGLADISSDYTIAGNDLSSEQYVEELRPTTLHGAKAIDDAENKDFWLTKNLLQLQNAETPKLTTLPTSIGFASQSIAAGINTVSLKLELDAENQLRALLPTQKKSLNAIELVTQLKQRSAKEAKALELNLLLQPFAAESAPLLVSQLSELKQLTGVSIFLDTSNAKQANQFSTFEGLGLDLRRVESSAQITKLVQFLDTNAKTRLIVSADAYVELSERFSNAQFELLVDVSGQYSIHTKGVAEILRNAKFWQDSKVKQLMIGFDSNFKG